MAAKDLDKNPIPFMSQPLHPTRIPVIFQPADADAAEDAGKAVCSAMNQAREAQACWARTPLNQRLLHLRNLRRLIAQESQALAAASATPRSQSIAESMAAEVLPLAEACRFLERQATSILAPTQPGARGRPLWLGRIRTEIRREPFGVVLIIGPGNYPLFLPGVQVIQSLIAGNAVLLKPGLGGMAAAKALSGLISRAGFPTGLLALLPESAAAARAAISSRPDKVLFTGSAITGEKILAQLAPHLIPAIMELSGCDALIVRADADLDLTVKALAFGLRLNQGATCLAPKRAFVHRCIATELEGRLAGAFRNSEAVPESINTSPRQTPVARETFAEALIPLIDDALGRGAHFICHEPQTGVTILGGVDPASQILRGDIFGPVVSIVTVADDDEAVKRANDCPFALGASVFSVDEAAARAIALRLNAGVVTINDLIIPTADAHVPFGGRGRSGFGVTRGAEGLLGLTRPKVVTVSRSRFRPAFGQLRESDAEMFGAWLRYVHGAGLKMRWRGLIALVRSIRRKIKSSATTNTI